MAGWSGDGIGSGRDLPLWRFPHLLLVACQMADQGWADVMGVSIEDAGAWLDGDHARAERANAHLQMLHAVITVLGRARTGQGIARWVETPLRELGDVRPLDWIAGRRPMEPLLLAARREAARAWGVSEGSRYWPEA